LVPIDGTIPCVRCSQTVVTSKDHPAGCTLTDVDNPLTKTCFRLDAMALFAPLVLLLCPCLVFAQTVPEKVAVTAGPPVGGGFFPLSEVHRGQSATAWTVFTGSTPEPMDVEILGVLRGARGPGHDMILAQLHGVKPEYTGVVAGMSGSPVYIGNRLVGALSYRIGQFTKDPIAGITPIEQMLEVRDLPIQGPGTKELGTTKQEQRQPGVENMQAMETPLVMGGFSPDAIRFWQHKMAGTGLEMVAAGGIGSASDVETAPSAKAIAGLLPGSAVSAQLVRGDLEIAATCTVTYIDAKQLLACGHSILQAGPVSLPMTTADVVATVASPLNAFKIVNTGETIGAFSEDRDAAIRGIFGARARMIPVHIRVHDAGSDINSKTAERKINVEILDLPALTPQAVAVVLFQSLLQTNDSTAEMSYHVTGSIDLEGYSPSPVDVWAPAGDSTATPMLAALQTGERFQRLYSNGSRTGAVKAVNLDVQAIPRRVEVELEGARLVSGNLVHAGDTVTVEATLRPWHEASRNVRIEVKLPARLGAGNLRLLVSDAGTLDRALDQPRQQSHPASMDAALSQARGQHLADHIYVSLLVPETQAGMEGKTLPSLPLSVANTLEPMRASQDASLNGESAELEADAPAGGVLSGFQLLNLRVEPGGGLN
jgi:hypothetical protein